MCQKISIHGLLFICLDNNKFDRSKAKAICSEFVRWQPVIVSSELYLATVRWGTLIGFCIVIVSDCQPASLIVVVVTVVEYWDLSEHGTWLALSVIFRACPKSSP